MEHSSLNQNKGVSLKQRAKVFGIDVDTIIQDLKDRISPHEDHEEYYSYRKRISNDFISGITEYARKYGLCRVVIGRIDWNQKLSVWILRSAILINRII